ncbi:hypothetical protein BDQ17DRAFT_1321316 [Cyathus striatus]|nr:hypothetical protein BDQ17DRAFT_1321316 [Cyathus striatus]
MQWLLFGLVATVHQLLLAYATTIANIQGPAFQSPLVGQTVHNVTGIVTAKSTSNGFFLAGAKVTDIRVSTGLNVFTTSTTVLKQVAVGDLISLSGKVAEFRSSTAPNDLFNTELESPTNIVVLSTNNPVVPVVLGKDRSPPTQQFSALDVGADGFLSVPNNSSRIESVNATLQPETFGMDFWESLEGQLVTIPNPISTAFPNSFGEFWVHGDWPVTGKNSRGGLSITFGPDGIPDGNPETIIIGSPLDGTKNPQVATGFALTSITGVVFFQFGFYYVLPLTAPTIISTPSPNVPPTTLTSSVENMAPTSSHLPTVASHIVNFLKTPDIMFLQEIQDNSGATDNGVVAANVTLTNLVNAIAKLSNVTYAFTEIDPVNDQDGGEPGGNIRTAYLYRSEKLSLVPGAPAGGSLDAIQVVGSKGSPKLNFNPGRIDPTNAAWEDSRKPLVAAWQNKQGTEFFTVNLHLVAKDGGSSTQGDARPPVNLPIDVRTAQVQTVSTFVESLLNNDPSAKLIVAGDCNEFVQTRSVFQPLTALLMEADTVANVSIVERYTYVFDQNNEQLDHVFVSPGISPPAHPVEIEHIHVNNWSLLLANRTSDHDPSVARAISRVCPGKPNVEGQKLVCKGRFLSNHEKVDEIWRSDERATVHLAVHPSAWTEAIPTPTIPLPPTPTPTTRSADTTAPTSPTEGGSTHSLSYVVYLHQNAIRVLQGQKPHTLDTVPEALDQRTSSIRYTESLGWNWPTTLDKPYPNTSIDSGLVYEQVTIESQPYLKLVNPGVQPTQAQAHALDVLSYTFTILSTSGNGIVVPQVQASLDAIPVPANIPAIPTVNEILQRLQIDDPRVPNQNPNPNPALPEIREIPIRPLLAPMLMLVFRTLLLLYFVAPARKPFFGILIFAWMLYEIWQPIRRGLRDLRRAAEAERGNPGAGAGAEQGQRQDDAQRQEQGPNNRRIPGGRLENQFASLLNSFGDMNLRTEDAIVNNRDTTELGWGYKLRTFTTLLFTTLHPAVWDRRRSALRRREGIIRTEARMRDIPPRTEFENEEARVNEERAELAREGLRESYARRPLWVRRYMERVVETEWVDDE